MPKWGLSAEMRKQEPYGLPQELLAPAKVITDPIHGDVRVTRLELRIIDSPSFQRLRRVRQLGNTHLVYPAATHSRFSHSLGSLVAAQMLFDIVLEQREGLNPQPDLFGEWEQEEADGGAPFLKRVAEATVLTRLGALLHDLCHVPFGHTVEDELQILDPHDGNAGRFERQWSQIHEDARGPIEKGVSLDDQKLKDDLLPMILSKAGKEQGARSRTRTGDEEGQDPNVVPTTYPFSQDIVGNTVSADLIDYLARDHRFTGLPAKLGHRFLDSFYVSGRDNPYKKSERMVLRIVRDDRERKDTITELLKFLRYRYELSERALVHHGKLAADAMVGKLLQEYRDGLYVDAIRDAAASDEGLKRHLQGVTPSDVDAIRARMEKRRKAEREAPDEAAGAALETLLLEHGDDGVLEYARNEGRRRAKQARWAGVRDIADALLNRQLFKPLARMSHSGHAQRLWDDYGTDPDARRQVEKAAADFAGILRGWFVVLWIPPEAMRLKPALALVDDGELIDTLLRRESSPRGGGRGKDIYDAHRNLWALDVYAHSSVRDDPRMRDAVLAALAVQLNIKRWDRVEHPVDPNEIALRYAGEELKLPRSDERRLRDAVPSFFESSTQLDQRGTLVEMIDELKNAWASLDGGG
jgi:HD superfamily phosphohydrolase